NLDIKPYALSGLTTDNTAIPAVSNKFDRHAGVDVKYGVTKALTADFTYNTDFAQVEADLQQVNLTRFTLFFPEKREFFLEGAGIFDFGGIGSTGNTAGGDLPIMFYSRRIGLSQDGHPIPLIGGGRITGRAGPFSIGVVNIQTEDDPNLGAVS